MQNSLNVNITASVGISLGAVFVLSCSSPDTAEENKALFENVVFIIGDDHSYTTLGCYGNDNIRTPNLDKLANNGTRFTNAYSNCPLCSASRQSMLTGKYPHATGVNLLFTPFPDFENITIAELLKQNGYSTALIGKSHLNHFVWWDMYEGEFPNHGFDTMIDGSQYKKFLKENPPKEVPANIKTRANVPHEKDVRWGLNCRSLPVGYYDEDSEGTFLANQAVEYIQKNKDNKFCLWLAFHQPHASFTFPVEYAGKYKAENMVLPETSDEDDRWVPEKHRDLTDIEKKGVIASYYSSVEYLDKNIGLVIDELEKQGLKEKTLIIYVGDQGYLLGDHKRFEKHSMWAQSIKAPLIISGGDILPKGKVSDALVEFVDIVPTVTTALGIGSIDDFQGKNILPVITNQKDEVRDYVFTEFLEDTKVMVANKKWKYIFTSGVRDQGQGYFTGFGPSGVYHRLYDLENDPQEFENVAANTANAELIKDLQQELLNWFAQTHPDADKCPNELNDIGKLVWYTFPRDVGAEYGGAPLRVFLNKE